MALQASSKLTGIGVSMKRPYMSLRAPTLDPMENDPGGAEFNQVDYSAGGNDYYDPVVDMEVPSVITLAVSRQVPEDQVISTTELPPLPPVTDPSFEELLGQKLHLCSQLMDFTVKGENDKQKDEKSKTLMELLSLFENKREALKLNGKLRRAIFRMIERNVLRVDPVFPTAAKTSDYTLNIVEPSWPHLFTCHQLLTQFVILFPDAEYVNFAVVQRALFLTQVPDANERIHFVNFLKAYYDTHPKDKRALLHVVRDKLILLVDVKLVPYCAMPLLLCLTHMMLRDVRNMREDFVHVAKEALLPLMGHRYLPLYYGTYKTAIAMVVRELPEVRVAIFNQLQAKWPVQCGAKEGLFCDLLIYMVSQIPSSAFVLFARQFFMFSARLCYSPNFKVVNNVLALFGREELNKFIKENVTMAVNQLYEPFYWASQHHWCIAIRELAVKMLEAMETIAKPECQRKKLVVKAKHENGGMTLGMQRKDENEPLRKWTLVAKMAMKKDPDLDGNEMLRQIKAVCVLHKEICDRDISRFIPFKRQKKLEDALKGQPKGAVLATRSFYQRKDNSKGMLATSSSVGKGLSRLIV